MKFKIMSEIIWGGEIILRDQKNRYTNLFPFMLSWRFSKAALGFWHKFQLSFPSCFPHLKWCPRAPNWRRQPAAAVISPALLLGCTLKDFILSALIRSNPNKINLNFEPSKKVLLLAVFINFRNCCISLEKKRAKLSKSNNVFRHHTTALWLLPPSKHLLIIWPIPQCTVNKINSKSGNFHISWYYLICLHADKINIT